MWSEWLSTDLWVSLGFLLLTIPIVMFSFIIIDVVGRRKWERHCANCNYENTLKQFVEKIKENYSGYDEKLESYFVCLTEYELDCALKHFLDDSKKEDK